MNKNTTGSFYFKRTISGNLIGEYACDESTIVSPENSTPQKPTIDFAGHYKSCWYDTSNHYADLDIKLKSGSTNIYSLEWTEPNNIDYIGEGFIVDEMLIGFYRSK